MEHEGWNPFGEKVNMEGIDKDDFEFVLKRLIDALKPLLKEEAARTGSAKDLIKEAQKKPPDCKDEIALAKRLLAPLAVEKVAVRLIPPEMREQLGPVEKWPWCIRHILCCLIFGWLLYRSRSFEAAVYYLRYFWICVRGLFGEDLEGRPLTPEEEKDFEVLSRALARVYRPFLDEQIHATRRPEEIARKTAEGKIDCRCGGYGQVEMLDRFLSPDVIRALFGSRAMDELDKDPRFWFCRCWCLCSIRFGWCLARAKGLVDAFYCLVGYFHCMKACANPLTCELIAPNECIEENEIRTPSIFRGVEIVGTAAGSACGYYTLEWRKAGTSTWTSSGIHYPGIPAPTQGTCGVINGTLGYLETFPTVPAGPLEIRLCVHPGQPGIATRCCTISFQLRRNLVWIRGIEGIEAQTPPGVINPSAQLVDSTKEIRSFGTAIKILGSAWVGGCSGERIKRYTLSFHPGFVTDPNLPGFVQFWQVDYNTPMQIDSDLNKVFERELTNRWKPIVFCFPPPINCITVGNRLHGVRWSTRNPHSYPVDFSASPPVRWISTPLPSTNCQSGKYTIRLTVEDNIGNTWHDLQQVWFDNKDIYGKITRLADADPCQTLQLSKYAPPGANCKVPWPVQILGIAYDEYIEEGNTTRPSDNFGGFSLWIKKDGAPDPGVPLPIPGPAGGGFVGSSRVGDPGKRCPSAVPPAGPLPAETPGVLAIFDLRKLDELCNPSAPELTIKRGECCTYVLKLKVWDRSICPSLPNHRHEIYHNFPVFICNDLPVD